LRMDITFSITGQDLLWNIYIMEVEGLNKFRAKGKSFSPSKIF